MATNDDNKVYATRGIILLFLLEDVACLMAQKSCKIEGAMVCDKRIGKELGLGGILRKNSRALDKFLGSHFAEPSANPMQITHTRITEKWG